MTDTDPHLRILRKLEKIGKQPKYGDGKLVREERYVHGYAWQSFGAHARVDDYDAHHALELAGLEALVERYGAITLSEKAVGWKTKAPPGLTETGCTGPWEHWQIYDGLTRAHAIAAALEGIR